MPIRYAPDVFFSLLEAQKLSQAYQTAMTEQGQLPCSVHLLPQAVPLNLLLQETIQYCLASGETAQNRRVSFLVHLNGRWIGFALNLAGFNAEKAALIQANLQSTNRKTLSALPSLLQDPPLVSLFRELYANIECVFLGLSLRVSDDVHIVRGQFIPLIQQAYAAQGMNALFIENPQTDSPDVVFLQDLVTVLKEGAFKGQQIQERITALRNAPEYQASFLFKQQNQAVITHLVSSLDTIIATESTDAAVTALNTALLLCVKRLRLVDYSRKNLDSQIGHADPHLIKTHYLQTKSEIYEKTAYTFKALLTIVLSNLDTNNLLKLMQAHPENCIALLLQGLTQFNQQLLSDIKAWQSKLQKLPMFSQKKVWQIGRQGLATLYQSTLAPIYATVFTVVGMLFNEALETIPYYSTTRDGVARGLHDMTRIAIYGLTLSETLSRQGADLLIGPSSACMALHLSGSVFGFYCAYTLGLAVFISTAGFILLSQMTHNAIQKPILNDETATTETNQLNVLTPQAISRLIGLAVLALELMITGNLRRAMAYFGGLLGSILAVYATQPREPRNQKENETAFLASISGQQIGQSLVYLTLPIFDAFSLKNEQRQAFADNLNKLMRDGEIENLEVTLSSFWTDPSTWFTDSNPVQASFHNRSSGFFTQVDCTIQGNNSISCELTQVAPKLKIS